MEADEQGMCTLVTGATSGIGEALAVEMSRTRDLILHGRDPGLMQSTLSKCSRPESHYTWICDLSDAAQAQRSFMDFLSGRQLRVQNFIHCAGVVRVAPIRQVTLEEIVRTLGVNLFSALALIRSLVQRDGDLASLRNVLFISSAASLRGEKGVAIYSASKGGVDSLVRSLAVELAPVVRVNAILPGLVRTPMSEATLRSREFQGAVQRKYPLGVGQIADVVNAALFLISDQARWVTGALWVVDGGRTAV